MWLAKTRKIDLLSLMNELGLEIPANNKIPNLCKAITESEGYNDEMVKNMLSTIVVERELVEERERREQEVREAEAVRAEKAEREKLDREYELKKLQLEIETKKIGVIETQGTSKPIRSKDLLKLMSKYQVEQDIGIYLALFERQMSRAEIEKTEWPIFLQSLLPLEIVNLIAREADTIANDYEEVKKLLLLRFKLNFEQFRQKFISHKKLFSSSWRDFSFDLSKYFDEWLSGLDIRTFEDLRELIITDQLKRRIPVDFREHFIDELPRIVKVKLLVEKLEEYETARTNLRKPRELNNPNEKLNKFGGRKFDQTPSTSRVYRGYDGNRGTRYSGDNRFGTSNKTGYNSDSKVGNIQCNNCKNFGHRAYFCPKRKENTQEKNTKSSEDSSKIKEKKEANEASVKQSKFNVRKIWQPVELAGQIVNSVIDTGSDITIIKRELYNKIGSPELQHDDSILVGIENKGVKPIGYLLTNLKLNGIEMLTKIFVVEDMSQEMLLGLDIITKNYFEITAGGLVIREKEEQFEKNPHRLEMGGNEKEGEGHYPESRKSSRDQNKCLEDSKQLKCNSENEGESVGHRAGLSEGIEAYLLKLSERLEMGNTEDLELTHIKDKGIQKEVRSLVEDYKPNKIKDTDLKLKIILKDDSPICQKPRRMAYSEREIVNTQIKEWLELGIVKESNSEFAAPIVLCPKKNGGHRIAIDYRKINKQVVRDRYPLPLIDDVIDNLEGAEIFTSLDLKNGFFHIDVDSESTKYTSFVTQDGQYEFLKMPFGLCIAPNMFQRYILRVFRDLVRDKILTIYMDDMIITAKTEEEGLEKLKLVMQRAADYGLELNLGKCQFMKRKIEFLGYVVEKGTIKPSPGKTDAVKNFPEPKTVKQLQSFLGLTGYFRKFIPQYSKIAKPLSDLLRGETKFNIGPEQREAIAKLKDALMKPPVLHIFKQGAELELHTDASSLGFGAILLQKSNDNKWNPIYYLSRKTTPQQEKYTSYELEVLAIVEALKKFRNYLIGIKFKIITDCDAFARTLNKRELAPRVARWALLMEEFDFETVHRPGKQLPHVDALSRNVILVTTQIQDEVTMKVAAAQEADEHLKIIKTMLKNGEENDHFLKNDVLYKYVEGRELLVIPQGMQTEIVQDSHEKGHFGAAKTEEIVKQSYYIPKVRKVVEEVIKNCVKCILCNRKRGKGEGLLNPIPKEDTPLSTYHIDHIGPLESTSKNYQHILTIIDAFTKFTWLYPCKTTSTKEAISKLKLQQTIFGNPRRIITDKGSAFNSKDFADYCKEQNIEHVQITTGIPRGNGQVERIHEVMIPVLAKLAIEDPKQWYRHVPDLQRVLNSTIARSTKFTPFELLVGVKMKNPEDQKIVDILAEEFQNCTMADRSKMRQEAKLNILKLQEENKKQYNKKRKPAREYKVGDLVAIRRTQYGSGLKLKMKFFGPYKITKVKSKDRYEVTKIGNHDGPNDTSTAADSMKLWTKNVHT